MSEEIKPFEYIPKYSECASCEAQVREGYVYFDSFGFSYCVKCFFAYKDLASILKLNVR